jgi:hypothetical protein
MVRCGQKGGVAAHEEVLGGEASGDEIEPGNREFGFCAPSHEGQGGGFSAPETTRDVILRIFLGARRVLPINHKMKTAPKCIRQVANADCRNHNLEPHIHVPNFKPLSTFKLKKANSYDVSDHFARIKHGQTEKLRQLFLIFDSHEDATSLPA